MKIDQNRFVPTVEPLCDRRTEFVLREVTRLALESERCEIRVAVFGKDGAVMASSLLKERVGF
jgi:hypothetical protein